MLVLRRIRADEGPQLKSIRLRAFAESPDAFGTTLAEARREPNRFWSGLAELAASSDSLTIIVAAEGDDWYGLARGSIEVEQPDQAELASLWVDPARRHSGVATALCEAIAHWAGGRRATCLRLWVTETNNPARNLYRRLGFVETDQFAPHPANPALREVLMIRNLQRMENG